MRSPWFKELAELLFPYRSHLEQEVEYLKGQLAQRQRRIDELQTAINQAALNKAAEAVRRIPPGIVESKPKGWDAYRAARKNQPEEEETSA